MKGEITKEGFGFFISILVCILIYIGLNISVEFLGGNNFLTGFLTALFPISFVGIVLASANWENNKGYNTHTFFEYDLNKLMFWRKHDIPNNYYASNFIDEPKEKVTNWRKEFENR